MLLLTKGTKKKIFKMYNFKMNHTLTDGDTQVILEAYVGYLKERKNNEIHSNNQ